MRWELRITMSLQVQIESRRKLLRSYGLMLPIKPVDALNLANCRLELLLIKFDGAIDDYGVKVQSWRSQLSWNISLSMTSQAKPGQADLFCLLSWPTTRHQIVVAPLFARHHRCTNYFLMSYLRWGHSGLAIQICILIKMKISTPINSTLITVIDSKCDVKALIESTFEARIGKRAYLYL